MKKLITALAIGAFTFAGTAIQADASPYGGHGYYAPQSSVYVSGYRHGRPIYTEKYFIGYDCYGQPRFGYRTVAAPRRHYDRHCDTRYSRHSRYREHYARGYDRGYYGDHRSSGGSVSFNFGR